MIRMYPCSWQIITRFSAHRSAVLAVVTWTALHNSGCEPANELEDMCTILQAAHKGPALEATSIRATHSLQVVQQPLPCRLGVQAVWHRQVLQCQLVVQVQKT